MGTRSDTPLVETPRLLKPILQPLTPLPAAAPCCPAAPPSAHISGNPKGVAISHRAVLATIAGVIDHVDNTWEKFTSDDVYLSYLPLAHIFDRYEGACGMTWV